MDNDKTNNAQNPKSNVFTIKGCKVTLNFLPESNGKAVATAQKILMSGVKEHKDILIEYA